jgi:hypothetical protein
MKPIIVDDFLERFSRSFVSRRHPKVRKTALYPMISRNYDNFLRIITSDMMAST